MLIGWTWSVNNGCLHHRLGWAAPNRWVVAPAAIRSTQNGWSMMKICATDWCLVMMINVLDDEWWWYQRPFMIQLTMITITIGSSMMADDLDGYQPGEMIDGWLYWLYCWCSCQQAAVSPGHTDIDFWAEFVADHHDRVFAKWRQISVKKPSDQQCI